MNTQTLNKIIPLQLRLDLRYQEKTLQKTRLTHLKRQIRILYTFKYDIQNMPQSINFGSLKPVYHDVFVSVPRDIINKEEVLRKFKERGRSFEY